MLKNIFSERDLEILLGLQSGCSGYIFPRVRLISITLDEYPSIFFYIDGELSEDDKESLSLIDLYAGTGFTMRIEQGDPEIIRVDYPNPIHDYPGECFYARKEPRPAGPTEYPVLDDVSMQKDDKIRIAMQRAMINGIFPQIRMITVCSENSTAHIHVQVDGEIAQEDRATLEEMRKSFLEQLPQTEMAECILTVKRTDFPQKERGKGGLLVYDRKEYEAYIPYHPYDVYASLTPGIQKGIHETRAEKFLNHKSGTAFVVSFQDMAYGAIFPQLRLVSMVRHGFCFELYFYVDGELSKSDKEAVEELRRVFGEATYRRVVKTTSTEIIRVDSPHPIDTYPGICLFARKENPPLVYPFQLENRLYNKRTPRDKDDEKGSCIRDTGPFSSSLSRERSLECKDDSPTEMGISAQNEEVPSDIDFYYKVRLAMQWAMLNRIFARIRTIQFDIEDHSVILRVVVSEPISEEEQATIEEMKLCFIEQLPDLQNCTMELVQIPFSDDPLDIRIHMGLPETVYYSKTNRRFFARAQEVEVRPRRSPPYLNFFSTVF